MYAAAVAEAYLRIICRYAETCFWCDARMCVHICVFPHRAQRVAAHIYTKRSCPPAHIIAQSHYACAHKASIYTQRHTQQLQKTSNSYFNLVIHNDHTARANEYMLRASGGALCFDRLWIILGALICGFRCLLWCSLELRIYIYIIYMWEIFPYSI